MSVQDPAAPTHVDRYLYRDGALVEPEPVAVGRSVRQLRARLFPARQVDVSILRSAIAEAPGAVGAEAGRVTHAVLERSEGESGWSAPLWRVHVEGPRGGGYVEYRLSGRRGRVVRW